MMSSLAPFKWQACFRRVGQLVQHVVNDRLRHDFLKKIQKTVVYIANISQFIHFELFTRHDNIVIQLRQVNNAINIFSKRAIKR